MTKEFARHLVIPKRMAAMSRVSHVWRAKPELPQLRREMRKTKMKNLATIVAAALILSSTVQFAAAASNHHQAKAQHAAVHQQRNPADAYASWPAERTDIYEAGPGYSGGYSAPAGR
jgi:hypothetical protein